jgi:hypothetical protein
MTGPGMNGPRRAADESSRTPSRAPRLAVALILATLPSGFIRDSLLGDLTHEFRERARRGALAARVWFWRTALQVASAFLWDRLRTAPAIIAHSVATLRDAASSATP